MRQARRITGNRTIWSAGPAVLGILLATSVGAYEVVRDVNSDKPAEKVILFEQGRCEHLRFDVAKGDCGAGMTDEGRLKVWLKGTGECLLNVGWTPGDGRPEGFDLGDFAALKLVCRLEGSAKVTGRGRRAKVTEVGPPEEGGVQLGLLDVNGMRLWGGSLSGFTRDEKNPLETEPVVAYFTLFVTPEAAVTSDIRTIQFRMPPRGRQDRDYRLIIERISLVE